jgi:hypothetical protein
MAAVKAELDSSPRVIEDVEGFMGKIRGEDHRQGNVLLSGRERGTGHSHLTEAVNCQGFLHCINGPPCLGLFYFAQRFLTGWCVQKW